MCPCAQLADDLPGVSLALSLHAPNQALRRTLVPSAAAYPLERLMAAIGTYQDRTRQKVPSIISAAYNEVSVPLMVEEQFLAGKPAADCMRP